MTNWITARHDQDAVTRATSIIVTVLATFALTALVIVTGALIYAHHGNHHAETADDRAKVCSYIQESYPDYQC